MSNPVRRSAQTRLSGQFRQDQEAEDQRQFVAFPLSTPWISQLLQGFVERSYATYLGTTPAAVVCVMLYSPCRVLLVGLCLVVV